jgi:Zn-dependent peptidase ImmA (M78 family)/DNA-binding XRE family transcriptional regulator
MIDRLFEPGRLRLARELAGKTQNELATELDVTPAAISQFESGSARPRAETIDLLARLLHVPAPFFKLPMPEAHEGFFRSLRRTSIADRRRARAIAQIAHDVAAEASTAGLLGQLDLPRFTTPPLDADDAQIERLADELRILWHVPTGPIQNIVGLLESHGIVTIRLPLASADVDAFSIPFSDRPVVVLGSDKNDRARSRFDAAHELGHLVMHGDQVWGLPEVERQAHRFAAAFLMPAKDIHAELPNEADWPVLFQLKLKWQVSLAALLMRARHLKVLRETAYLNAIKTTSARGWRRVEPVPLGQPESSEVLRELLNSSAGDELRSMLPGDVLDALLGDR